jgi:hypothetical protein
MKRVVLGVAVAATLGASGIYLANADAAETQAPAQLQAEAYSAQSGAQTENTRDTGGGRNVGWLANGDWMEYTNVTIAGADLTARIAAQNPDGGSIELHLGTRDGALLATFPVAFTGNWQKWTTVAAKATSVPTGPQTLFAVMKSASHSDFVNINYFTLGTGTGAGASATPTSAAPSSPAPTPSASTGTSGGGWVKVDQAAWQKQLAAFDAIVPAPVTAGTTRVPEFHVDCTVSNEAKDDPIVFPGQPGASHMHTFFGPGTTASTTPAGLLASQKTTCNSAGDNSAYWVPQLQHNGAPVPIKSMRVYYGSRVKDPSTVKPFPAGLVVVQGDAKLQVPTPKGASGQFWCAGSAEIGRSADGNWPVCAPGGNLIFQLVFQDCWDGVNLDSPNHKLHMGPPKNGVCTGDYPVAVPDLSFMVNYNSLGGDGLTLSSGMASSMHGDFMMGWDPKALGALVKTCVDQNAKCGVTPGFVGG